MWMRGCFENWYWRYLDWLLASVSRLAWVLKLRGIAKVEGVCCIFQALVLLHTWITELIMTEGGCRKSSLVPYHPIILLTLVGKCVENVPLYLRGNLSARSDDTYLMLSSWTDLCVGALLLWGLPQNQREHLQHQPVCCQRWLPPPFWCPETIQQNHRRGEHDNITLLRRLRCHYVAWDHWSSGSLCSSGETL